MRRNYWTCSNFADWLRGTPKPSAETSKGWYNWEKEAKEKHPFRYWLADDVLGNLQDFVMWPIDQLYKIKYWFNNRFISKTHTLTSNLKKGQWHELETRILHCMFDELVNFVEIEQAWHYVIWDSGKRKEYKTPWYATGWWRFRVWRSADAGLAYLNWAKNLVCDENSGFTPDHELYGKPTSQAESAAEILILYYWWTEIRPARPDPYDVSGWSELCDRRRSEDSNRWWWHFEDRTEEDREESRKSLAICDKLEKEYNQEDEEMMIRLIKVRQSLWT